MCLVQEAPAAGHWRGNLEVSQVDEGVIGDGDIFAPSKELPLTGERGQRGISERACKSISLNSLPGMGAGPNLGCPIAVGTIFCLRFSFSDAL